MSAGPQTSAKKQTNDPAQLHAVITKLFTRVPVRLLFKNGSDAPTMVLAYESGLLRIEAPVLESKVRLLTLKHRESHLILECIVVSRDEAGETLRPVRLHIRNFIRSEKRHPVGATGGPVVTSCLAINAFPQHLASMNKKRDVLLRVYTGTLAEKFSEKSYIKIQLRRTSRMDHRMRLLHQWQRPIFAPDIRERAPWAVVDPNRFIRFEDYETILRYESPPKEIISELTQPLWYRGLYLYGFVQILSEQVLTEDQQEYLGRLAQQMEKDLEGYECLPMNPVTCPLVDISRHGLAFLHPHNANIIKAFMPGENIIFDLNLPGREPASYTGVIKNIRALEKAHRFGIQLDDMSPEQEQNLAEYLEARSGSSNAGGGES